MENNIRKCDPELIEFEHIFLPIGKTITDFAGRWNMYLEKYYQRQPIWTLFFIRKIGGVTQIAIQFNNFDKSFYVSILWYIDVYEEETRYTMDWNKFKLIWKYKYSNDPEKLHELLEKAVQKIRLLKREDLNVANKVGQTWKQHWLTKEEFEKQYFSRYPTLDI